VNANSCNSASTDPLLFPTSHVLLTPNSIGVQNCEHISSDDNVTETAIDNLSVANSHIETYLMEHYLQQHM
jgi:hypothetical protein